ncbi:phosphate ABC transporter, ATP-binding protein [Okibacterium fritillariae]|uniref:Phosphate ABC transporter, ATP-binding protein n=1 Tax=Okibacterium fritillariae TaxID=123320 RepID=A0A1T5JQ27_9MICO|nr:phosphate ABC transporter, ATP-binding protein [Okibacterium fritillariae]
MTDNTPDQQRTEILPTRTSRSRRARSADVAAPVAPQPVAPQSAAHQPGAQQSAPVAPAAAASAASFGSASAAQPGTQSGSPFAPQPTGSAPYASGVDSVTTVHPASYDASNPFLTNTPFGGPSATLTAPHAAAPASDPGYAPAYAPASATPGAPLIPAGFEQVALHPFAGLDPARAPLAELDARNISAWFGDHQVLDRVSLTMPAGVVTALIGPSGCGKSTFLRILNRMHELIPSASLAGEVLIDGEDIYDTGRRLVDARKSIGMVFQKPNPFPAMSIYDNVIAGLTLTGTRSSRDERDYLVESCLTKAGLWKEVRDRLRAPGGGLSGGQQQRLCIARSLAVKPRVLLMDEPCSALDPTSTRVIEETMLELVNDVTIVIVTHNMQQAQRVSGQCAFFLATQGQPGAIVEHGDTEAMFDSPLDSRTFDYVNGRFG